MPFAHVEGLKIHYAEKGKGSTLLLIHGAASSHLTWRPQFEYLGDIFHSIAIDLPGHGRSEAPDPSEISIVWYTEFVNRFLKAMGIEKTTLIGHSMGGAISIQFCLDYPDSISSLVLTSTGAKLGVSPALFSVLRSDFIKAMEMGFMTPKAMKMDQKLIQELRDDVKRLDPKIGVADFEACDNFDQRERIGGINKPTLVMGATKDPVHPKFWSEYLHEKIKGSKLKILEGDTMYMLEKPEEVNPIISEFLKEQW